MERRCYCREIAQYKEDFPGLRLSLDSLSSANDSLTADLSPLISEFISVFDAAVSPNNKEAVISTIDDCNSEIKNAIMEQFSSLIATMDRIEDLYHEMQYVDGQYHKESNITLKPGLGLRS